MRFGIPISLLLHALILGWSLIAMKSTREFKKPDIQPIALEIITEGELAQMRKGDEKSKEKELEAAKDSQSLAQKETPKPKPKPAPKVAEAKPVTPPVKTGTKPSTFDAQQIAALIDKSPNAAPAPASTASPTPTQKASKTAAGIRDGQGPKLSQNEQQALTARLVAQIKRCWRPPTGIPDAKNAIPVVSFKLARDGSVSGSPSVLNRQGSSSFQLASEAATRAILQCQPYDMPADKYDGGWSAVELDFDPSTMF
jgi:hypothetical protein